MLDTHLEKACAQVRAAASATLQKVAVTCFFDEPTNTASYVIHDPVTKVGAVVDSVLDFDAAAGRTSTASADQMIDYIQREALTIEWLLETHAHADHLSAAPYIQGKIGGKIAIGADPGDDAAVREQPVGAAPSCVPVHACDEQPWRECSARRRPLSRVSNSALSQRPQHLHP